MIRHISHSSFWVACVFLFSLSTTLHAVTASYPFDDPEKEIIYKNLINELRCLVCQNQTLADSNADLAVDLRQKTYDMIKDGRSKDDVIDYMVQRYGGFILYNPPLNKMTWLLWIGPFVILGGAIIALIFYIRGRNTPKNDPDVPEKGLQQAKTLLNKNQQDKLS